MSPRLTASFKAGSSGGCNEDGLVLCCNLAAVSLNVEEMQRDIAEEVFARCELFNAWQ